MNVSSRRVTLAAGLALGIASPARAGEQHLIYDLSVDGAAVGTREVTVTYLTRPSGERHLVESYTHIAAPGLTLESHGSGLSTPGGAQLSSATERDGKRSSVAAQELPEGGWQVTVVSGGKQNDRTEADVRMSTFDLTDPARTGALDNVGTFGVVLAETGDVLVGTLAVGKPSTVTIGGQAIPVSTFVLSTPSGTAQFMVTSDGMLVRSEMTVLGLDLVGTLRALPPARDYGAVETVEGLGGGVKEGDL